MAPSSRPPSPRRPRSSYKTRCTGSRRPPDVRPAGGPLQLSLFDEQDLAEIESPGYPGERLICCRNPFLAAERARKRQDLLAATEQDLGKIAARVAAGRIKDPAAIGRRVGKVLNKRKMAKYITLDIAEGRISWQRDTASINAEALTDGIYVIRTPVPAKTLDPPGVVASFKGLVSLERDFRSIKADDLDLRPFGTCAKTASKPTC